MFNKAHDMFNKAHDMFNKAHDMFNKAHQDMAQELHDKARHAIGGEYITSGSCAIRLPTALIRILEMARRCRLVVG